MWFIMSSTAVSVRCHRPFPLPAVACVYCPFSGSALRADKMLPVVASALLATWTAQLAFALVIRHDDTFIPDHILRVTNDNIDIACDQHRSVVVNGTTPGPILRLAPGTSSWIRVYNDVEDQNLTMVCP